METLQQWGAVAGVLGLLGLVLCTLRRRGLAQIALGGAGRREGRSLQLVERLALGPQHALYLVRVSGRPVVIATSPAGCSLLDPGDAAGGPQ